MTTFSAPLMMKYPPWSYWHSPCVAGSTSTIPSRLRWQKFDLSMMGRLPMNTATDCGSDASSSSPVSEMVTSWTVMSTFSGAAYVRLRSRAW